jgi:ATP-dependent helicase HrpA
VRQVVRELSPATRLALQFNPDGEIADLVADCADAAADELIVAATGRGRLPDVVRYLRAMAHRLEKLPVNAVRDALGMQQVAAVAAEYEELRRRVPVTGTPDDPVMRIRWMIEELRVSLFAQGIGTPRPISEQRVYKAIDQLIA